MKKITLLLLASILSPTLFAANCNTAKNTKDCLASEGRLERYLSTDVVYFTDGVFRGLEINQEFRRPVAFIPELENNRSYFVRHFYNQGKFWVAEVPKVAVKNIIFQLALFDGPLGLKLAHAQLRFLSEAPIKLYRLRDGKVVKTQTNDFIFTIQAALPKGEEYNAINAFTGSYKIVSRLINSYDRAMLEEIKSGDIVTQHRLKNLTRTQMDALLIEAIKFSNKNLLSKDYIGTTENCISITFDILDKALALDNSRVTLNIQNFFFNGQSPNEKMALDALKERNLIDAKSRIENYK